MKKSAKNNSKNKSIDISGNSESENEEEADGFDVALAGKMTTSVWATGGQQRDHAIQVLLNLVSNLGVRDMVPVEGSPNTFREVFYKGSYAIENVNGLRQFMRDMEDPVTRELMIQISKYKMMPRYIVPLYCMSLDDRMLSMPLLRLFLLLTKPLAASKSRALSSEIRGKRSKESAQDALLRIALEQENKTNAYAQVEALISFKACLITEEVFGIILSQAADALLKEPSLRNEDDKKVIECTLMLISNLLAIEPGPDSTATDKAVAKELQNKLILILAEDFFGLILLLCQTIMDKVNRPWNFILVEIVYYLLRHRDAKDLVKISSVAKDDAAFPRSKKNSAGQSGDAVSGALHDALCRERAERLAAGGCGAAGSRMNRLGGVLVLPPPVMARRQSGGDDDAKGPGGAGVAQMVRDPRALLNDGSYVRPHANKKRAKANFTCIQDPSYQTSMATSRSSAGRAEEDRRVLQVLQAFLDTLLVSGFGELVYSVKEGWRREDPMKGAEEMMYFSVVATCLQYQRLKVQGEHKKRHLATASAAPADVQQPWVPDLKNITQCFDRMSIMRPIDCIIKIREESKLLDQLAVPMELYKEQVCILRIMLESDDLAHNDIALGALHKIFYMSYTERMDPVVSLVREWKPGAYSRHHLNVLIELVHETLKLLDTADYCFKQESMAERVADAKSGTKKKDEKDDERAQYVASALRFDPNEYFRRLVSNQSTKLYTRALELFASNPQHINHYIFVFLRRMCSYKIENDEMTSRPPALDSSKDLDLPGDVTLGHLLFNIPTLSVFSDILNDRVAVSNKQLEPLLRLIRGVVRKFGETVSRNRMMFVEVLFQHAHPISSWLHIEGMYDALSIAKGISSGGNRVETQSLSSEDERSAGGGSESEDMGDEFDDNMDLVSKAVSRDIGRKKGKRPPKEKRSRGADDQPLAAKRRRGRQWSAEEDEALRKLYALYAGSSSVFNVIAQSDELTSLGGNRSVLQVSRRVREMDLHLMLSFDGSGDDEPNGQVRATTDDGGAGTDSDSSTSSVKVKKTFSALSPSASPSATVSEENGQEGVAVASTSKLSAFWDSDVGDDADDERWRRVQRTSGAGLRKSNLRRVKERRSSGGALSDSNGSDLEDGTLFQVSQPAGNARSAGAYVLLDSDDE